MKKSILVLSLALPLLGASCFNVKQNLTDAIAEQATESVLEGVTGSKDVELNGNQVSVTGNNGEKIEIGANKLPDNFPTSVPVYTNATVQSSFSNGNAGADSAWTVTFLSDDALSTVNDFFKSALATNGWVTTYSYSLDTSHGYTAKNENLAITLTISAGDDGKTNIFLIIHMEEPEADGE